jgi:hypothetical protein
VQIHNRLWTARLAGLAFAYFVLYPQDLSAMLNPVERTLTVSNAASPWLYAVIGVGILSWTVMRIRGKDPVHAERPNVPPI